MPEDKAPEFLESGKIRFGIDGKTYEWRRPKVKEYRTLLERSMEMAGKLPADMSTPTPEMVTMTTEISTEWFMAAHEMLGKPALEITDPGDLPAWVLSAEFMSEVVQHFTQVPKAAPGH